MASKFGGKRWHFTEEIGVEKAKYLVLFERKRESLPLYPSSNILSGREWEKRENTQKARASNSCRQVKCQRITNRSSLISVGEQIDIRATSANSQIEWLGCTRRFHVEMPLPRVSNCIQHQYTAIDYIGSLNDYQISCNGKAHHQGPNNI